MLETVSSVLILNTPLHLQTCVTVQTVSISYNSCRLLSLCKRSVRSVSPVIWRCCLCPLVLHSLYLTLFLTLMSIPLSISSCILSVSFLFAASWNSFSERSTTKKQNKTHRITNTRQNNDAHLHLYTEISTYSYIIKSIHYFLLMTVINIWSYIFIFF